MGDEGVELVQIEEDEDWTVLNNSAEEVEDILEDSMDLFSNFAEQV